MKSNNEYLRKKDSISNQVQIYQAKYDSINQIVTETKQQLEQIKNLQNNTNTLTNPYLTKAQQFLSNIKKFEIGKDGLITAVLGVLSFPVLLSGLILLIFDRNFGTSFYLSDIFVNGVGALSNEGGSAILYQHLFWFLGHPEVYIVLLPALGISSEVIATNSRKPIFGYKAMVGSILGIGFLSFIVWGHYMFVTGMNPFLGSVFVFTTLLIAIPSAVKAFNYITTLWQGNIRFTPAMLFSIGLVSTFVTGGLTGIILADSALDVNVHDTYFVVAHFHIVMGMSAIFGMLAGIYHWFPKMFGRMMNTKLGFVHFWITIICGYGVFFPMHFLGLAGLPRRYYSNAAFPMFDNLADINVLITFFAIIGGVAMFIFLFNFFFY